MKHASGDFWHPVTTEVLQKAALIRLAVFDVDGVLTDGGLYYSAEGEMLKRFHAHDGLGLKLLMQHGIDVAIISARKSEALQRRITDLGIEHAYLACENKSDALKQLLENLKLTPAECCYTGDDIIDLDALVMAGLAISVDNAHAVAKQAADWVSPLKGGHGAARSICDLLLYSQGIDLATKI